MGENKLWKLKFHVLSFSGEGVCEQLWCVCHVCSEYLFFPFVRDK